MWNQYNAVVRHQKDAEHPPYLQCLHYQLYRRINNSHVELDWATAASLYFLNRMRPWAMGYGPWSCLIYVDIPTLHSNIIPTNYFELANSLGLVQPLSYV